MNWMEGSDAADIERARAGDTHAFGALVERHSRTVFRLAYRMTGNEQDAEDVVQETFLRVYRRLDRFEKRSNFGTWLYRIAMNCSLDFLRSRSKNDARYEVQDIESDSTTQFAASDPMPDRMVFGSQVKRAVATALGDLTAQEKAAFVLRHYEGLSVEEIGRMLGLRTSATKHSIFRAVHKLRKSLTPVLREAS